jgi:competence protein ComEA
MTEKLPPIRGSEARHIPAPRVRLRLSLGAGVVLLVVAAAVAVLITALAPRAVTAAATSPRVVSKVAAVAAEPSTASGALVHVVGQVRHPGLYELPAGDRIVDAITAAGGFTSAADESALDLAQVIQDGQQIVVGKKGAALTAADPTGGAAAPGALVDINTADLTQLETLDGIGPALAQRILDYRSAHGSFASVGDLQNVTGIGPKKYAAIKASVST